MRPDSRRQERDPRIEGEYLARSGNYPTATQSRMQGQRSEYENPPYRGDDQRRYEAEGGVSSRTISNAKSMESKAYYSSDMQREQSKDDDLAAHGGSRRTTGAYNYPL